MADPIIGKISVGDGATFTPAVSSAGELSWTNNKNLPNPETVDIAQAVVDKKPGWGIPIGYEYFTINPNVPQGSLPLFGGEYSRETYPDLWAWVQTQTGYLKTEAQWQTLATNNNGNVPYYSDGDGSTTFRVPSLKCWVKAANGTVTEVGSYLAAGLPNITGKMGPFLNNVISGGGSYTQGVFTMSATGSTMDDASRPNPPQNLYGFNFDASRSSSIYGNSTTVQPESIVGMWLVKAYGTVVDTGQIDEQQYIDDRIAALPNTFLPLSGGTMTGALGWNGNSGLFVICNQKTTNDSGIILEGGSSYGDGASISIYGKNGSYPGSIFLEASNGTDRQILSIRPDGSLKYSNKEIERVNASGTNYIRYESGLQICWGYTTADTSGTTVTFPLAFRSTGYVVMVQVYGSSLSSGLSNKTTTSVKVYSSHATVQAGLDWIAVGLWR